MFDTIYLLASAVPLTGDNFDKRILFAVIGAAVLLAVGTTIFAKKKSTDDDGSEDKDEK